MLAFLTSTPRCSGSPSHCSKLREKKDKKLGQKNRTVITCRWYEFFYIENPKESTEQLVKTRFINDAGYKVNICKNLLILFIVLYS